MLRVWVVLCLVWQGANCFLIYNAVDSLCLEDSLTSSGVLLKRCNLVSNLQEWVWSDKWFLKNVGTQRCLSAFHNNPVHTMECDYGEHLEWDCTHQRLISLNRSLELGAEKEKVVLTQEAKTTRWKSLDGQDFCQEKLRSRRQSELEGSEDSPPGDVMTKEQREYIQWYYRTEDPTTWSFALLGLSFIALLLGCVLLVIGMMGNRNRKKIAKYKAAVAISAVAKAEMEELQVIPGTKDDKNCFSVPNNDEHLDNTYASGGASETESPKPGEIIVTWKDGNVSNLYADALEEEEEEKL